LDIRPRICLPPVDRWTGTSPVQAAKSRPRLNVSIGGAKVWTELHHHGGHDRYVGLIDSESYAVSPEPAPLSGPDWPKETKTRLMLTPILYRNFNKILVRIFIQIGAPFFQEIVKNKRFSPCLRLEMPRNA